MVDRCDPTFVDASVESADSFAERIYDSVCRTELGPPGYCLIDSGIDLDSFQFRRQMVGLKTALADVHLQRSGNTLIYQSALRFDQQTSTRPHFDGGPDQSLLMLGYEPTAIASELTVFDWARCAADQNLTPAEFIRHHNPMFGSNIEFIRPYAEPIDRFDHDRYQIVCINNSSCDPIDGSRWRGMLHTASVPQSDETRRRIINSTMIIPAPPKTADKIGNFGVDNFLTTTKVHRRGYDKDHLRDDQ